MEGRIDDMELGKLENIFNFCVNNIDCDACPYDKKCYGAGSIAKLGIRLIDEMKLRDLESKGFFWIIRLMRARANIKNNVG